MVKKKHTKKNERNKKVLINAGFDEGEIWRLDFKGEVEYEENVVDQSRYEVPLFDFKGYRTQKKAGKPMGQDIEMEEQHESDSSYESSGVVDAVAEDDFEEYDTEQQKEDESRFVRKQIEFEVDYMKKLRVWEASFFIHTSENLENTQQEFFYVIEFGHVNPERNYEGTLKRMMVYTAATFLNPGEVKVLSFPIIVWPKKIFYISYSELEMFQISIKLWTIGAFTFNQLLASVKLTLKDILDSEPETYLMFKKHLPAPLGKDGKPRRDLSQKSFEVHRSRVTLQLQEIFDFDISLENWTFIPNKKLPIEIKRAPKFLRLKVPLNNDINSGISSRETMITPYSTGGYWQSVCKFVFTGTRCQLRNAYIIVEALAYLKFGPSVIGAAMISLASVESYPLVKTTIKRVTIDIYKIIAGEMIGNVFCYSRSTGQPTENIRSRPSQIAAGAALVSQLNLNERYLVFRLFKCDNLAAADGVTGTSDPIVKVTWDGIVNTSSVREKTRRPVYNQNLYFPVRVLDQRELIIPSFRRKCLPIDLLCKGPLKIEVWNRSDTSSILLGSGEVNLNKMYTLGKEDFRCLAEGLIDKRSRRADGKPNFDQEGDRDVDNGNIFINNTLYALPYNTLVLNMNMLLQSKGFGKSVLKPSIHFEMYFIPPFPPDVVIPAPPSTKAISNIWKQLGNRWNRDFHKWKGIYKQWFSSAPDKRNFNVLQRHPQTEEILPICSFVSPIAVPNLISNEGSLLHWINNFMYITLESQVNPPGKIPELIPPHLFLLSKKGSIADHVLMLCSCLMGMGFDAYVCKGTIENGTLEHMWIMTRHKFGHVQFWEVTNKQRYVLPFRYGQDPYYLMKTPFQQNAEIIPSVNNDNNDIEVPDDNSRVEMFEKEREYYNGLYLQQWFEWLKQTGQVKYVETHVNENMGIDIWGEFLVPDIKINPTEIDYENPVEEDITDIGNRKSDKTKFRNTSLDTIKMVITEYIKNIPIVPDKRFLTPELISYVPYSTIELVFNNRQVWGNLGNHHPALITYDLNNPYKWRSFCGSKPENIFQDLIIEPPLQGRAVEKLEESISVSLEENIVLNRQKLGKETLFDRSPELGDRINAYLTLLEFKLTLDPLYDPGPPDNHTAWSALKTKEMILKEEKEMKERQEKEQKRILKLKKKSNFEDMLVTKQISPGSVGNYSGQDPQVDFFNTNFYGNLETKPDDKSNRNKPGDNLVPQCYTNMAINASNNSNNPNAVGRDFKSEFPSLQYDPKSPYATNFNSQNINTNNTENNSKQQQFLKNPTHNSADPKKMDSYRSFFQQPNSENIENRTKALTQSLKGDLKFDVSNIPPNIHSGAHVIAKTKSNENNREFFVGEAPSKSNDQKISSRQNMENEIIDLEEQKSLEKQKDEDDKERLENDVKYWNALVEDEMADNLEIEPELPDEGVNLSKIGIKAKISNWKKPEKETVQKSKDEQKGNISEQQLEAKAVKTEDNKLEIPPQVNAESQAKPSTPEECKDDKDEDEDEEIQPPPWRKLNRPLKYINDQISKWNWYYRMEQLYYDWQAINFPTFPMSTFTGFPIHFSTADPNDVRAFIVGSKRFRIFIELPQDEYQKLHEFHNIRNLGEFNFPTDASKLNFQNKQIYEDESDKLFKTKEKNFKNGNHKSRTNELHKFGKYWLKKLGVPKELPPSAWCNEDGVIVGIPITNDLIKILNRKIKSIKGRQIPIITEDFIDDFLEHNENDQLYSSGMNIACSGKAVISNSFYEISGSKRIDSLMISFPGNEDCEFSYEFSTNKYKYRVYKIDPFDERLWADGSIQYKDNIKTKEYKINSNGKNVRTSEWEINSVKSKDDDIELPSNISIISVCISRLYNNLEELPEPKVKCYSNARWYKSVRGRLLHKSESGKLQGKITEDGKYLIDNDFRDSSMFGMIISSVFTAGVQHNINVPNDEDEHIFFNKLDVKNNGENAKYFRKLYLWPSYCEYKVNIAQRIENSLSNKKSKTKIYENGIETIGQLEQEYKKDDFNIIVKNGCPKQGVKLNILLNTETLLIFSLFDDKWNNLQINTNQNISLRCAVKLYNIKQTLESQDCFGHKLNNSTVDNSNISSRNKRKSWMDIHNEFNIRVEKEVNINHQDWTERKWGDYFGTPIRMLTEGQWSFNPNLRYEQMEVTNIQPNTIGLRSEITGKSILNTPKIGRESISGGSGNKSYLLFNKQHADTLNSQNIKSSSSGFSEDKEHDEIVSKSDLNLYSRRLPSEPMIHSIFQNVLWRDWLIRYAPLVGNNGNFVRVGTNFAFAFLGESYIEEAATLGFSYDRAILSYLSGKRLSQLGRFTTFGYTQGLYGVRVDRSSTINAWGVDLQARYFISSTLVSFGLREYAQHISVRDIGLSLRHSFSQKDVIVGQQFSTEAIASYKTLFVDVATNVKNRSYGMAVGLRGYQFTVVRNFSTRTTDFLGNWGNGWQLLLSSTSPGQDDPTIVTRAGAGRLGRSFVLAGAGIGRDMIPIVSFQTQLDDVGVILEFSPGMNERIFAYGIEVNHFAYFWESIFSAERVPVPMVLGVEPKELSNAIFG
ncbi:hypothetical protein OIY81_796 [Cryptosporidium canis]|nr:hypothetical protein OIY81_796 [Cryptosporidium canis]